VPDGFDTAPDAYWNVKNLSHIHGLSYDQIPRTSLNHTNINIYRYYLIYNRNMQLTDFLIEIFVENHKDLP
jgi:hypothetical protein